MGDGGVKVELLCRSACSLPVACANSMFHAWPSAIPPADKLNAAVVKAPKSGKSFWDLGDFDAEFEAARKRALPVLRTFMEQQAERAEQEKQSEDFEQPWQYPQRSAVF